MTKFVVVRAVGSCFARFRCVGICGLPPKACELERRAVRAVGGAPAFVVGSAEKRVLHFVQDDKICGGAGGGIVLRTILIRWLLWSPTQGMRIGKAGKNVPWVGYPDSSVLAGWQDFVQGVF